MSGTLGSRSSRRLPPPARLTPPISLNVELDLPGKADCSGAASCGDARWPTTSRTLSVVLSSRRPPYRAGAPHAESDPYLCVGGRDEERPCRRGSLEHASQEIESPGVGVL
jgi:hypothetical protein